MRNPYAKSLRVHHQRVIPDKRESTLRQIYDRTLREELPDDLKNLLDKLD